MPPPKTDFPPVRACLFDMDGLLLDSEDKYTICTNAILKKYGKPSLPWSIKAQLQGRPGTAASEIFHSWAQLPISHDEYLIEQSALQREHFPTVQPLPGVAKLLSDLGCAHVPLSSPATTSTSTPESKPTEGKVHIALATSSHAGNFKLKTDHLEELFSIFPTHRRVLGDDPRIPHGRGKPNPDIYHLALEVVNSSLEEGERPIVPEECLVFEDSVPGVEAGRRAGMRVAWVPHVELKKEYNGREKEVLAGLTGQAGDNEMHLVGEVDDGWADCYGSLEGFPYERYGIIV
ncbi:uncharacterized protein BP5553_04156 [Venustampulla echinocandica]|uniref:HAD-like protein n=1 Tax=Venustampulla echinocandica TaxID=2656787 RepID=A0A370TWA4_9HELO|nr:uncharacterized protein BP5553_04156 [Venustampulla echinocandica]RDL39816.1 hypothetical protein BP5553_04156 [Venustampulla echinocandica]